MRIFLIMCALLIVDIGSLLAQHCPFDNTFLLVVRVEDAASGKPISEVLPVLRKAIEEGDRGEVELLKFIPNPEKTDENWVSEYGFHSVRYAFAEDNFILAVPGKYLSKSMIIQLFDSAGNQLGESCTITSTDYFDLHTHIGSNWRQINELGETPPLDKPFQNLITLKVNQ